MFSTQLMLRYILEIDIILMIIVSFFLESIIAVIPESVCHDALYQNLDRFLLIADIY